MSIWQSNARTNLTHYVHSSGKSNKNLAFKQITTISDAIVLSFFSSSFTSPKLKSLLSFWQKRGLMWTVQRYIHPDACCFPGNAQLPLQITRGTEMWIRHKSVQPVQITWLHVTQLRVWACQGLPDPFLLTSETRAGEFGSSRLLDWLLLSGL